MELGGISMDERWPGLSEKYTCLSCIKDNERFSVWLAACVSDGQKVILKKSTETVESRILENEYQMLRHLESLRDAQEGPEDDMASLFPAALEFSSRQTEEGVTQAFLARSWIAGMTLEDICETGYSRSGIPQVKSLDYLIRMCEIVGFLHRLDPPVIHRDIKPQNIVVDPAGECHLIDFGISRLHTDKGTSITDTHVLGTKAIAPPEQFGYRQTDERSDIYSLGIVLYYCLTGEYDPSRAETEVADPHIRQVIHKATMFDPDHRYQTAADMRADLLECRFGEEISRSGHRAGSFGRADTPDRRNEIDDHSYSKEKMRRRPRSRHTASLLVSLVVLAGLLLAGGIRYITVKNYESGHTDTGKTDLPDAGEVRVADTGYLGPADTNSAGFADTEDSVSMTAEEAGPEDTGHTDLTGAPNPGSVNAGNTPASDPSAVCQFQEPLIEAAVREILNRPEGELTFGDLRQITSLNIYGMLPYSSKTQMLFFGTEPDVYEWRQAGLTLYKQRGTIRSLGDLSYLPNLTELNLHYQQIEDLSILEQDVCPGLITLGLGNNPINDYSPLGSRPDLKSLNLAFSELSDLSFLEPLTGLESLVLAGTGITSIAHVPRENLHYLNLADISLTDPNELKEFPALDSLFINRLGNDLMSIFPELPLKTLSVCNSAGRSLSDLPGMPFLEELIFGEVWEADNQNTPANFPSLRILDLAGVKVTDFHFLKGLKRLEVLKIYNTICDGYEGLDELDSLTRIECSKEQAEEILERYPELPVLLYY